MNGRQVERVHHISITHTLPDGTVRTVSRTEVRVTDDTDEAVSYDPAVDGDCFDPSTCCSEREQAMIAALRAYLRPDEAPECLKARVKACLDHCCGQ
ncbi:hypothetical protein JS531_03865 [Bifidobacterium sp. CP2]|uniref:hypothetical protein n=1 Tax=Bifidobacterium TaxID=1678 RepID=UPI001BDD5034|nr:MULTISPECIES: hypothetical protein [Bifidobacterium]MBT1181119.1 hypothetical protein [Bifidobacterium sp. CP2]MBW3081638.1 hypothetical protein [Bifidobacterium saguinibicoloris]